MIKIFKKSTLLLLFVTLLGLASCAPYKWQESPGTDISYRVEYFDKYFRLKITPKENYSKISVTVELYHHDIYWFEKYNKQLFAEIDYTFENVEKGETYMVKYDLETEKYPNMKISEIDVKYTVE